ncbi:hypothetical protein NE237_023261 [Protea cynaroides]|uniref:Uncharacterized protein n=1 Tax=Protea cynaroides TaxID=273540 RepID=A0A9Q0HBE6_9MAGN|nr:hypothetical protein NE237_023261 [Protea cynaroides]
MEKQVRSRGKNIFPFLPGAITFRKPQISPGHDKKPENRSKYRTNAGKSFSGPITSIIPVEARRKSRNGSFDGAEPTSPKVSCMGQIIQKHKKLKDKHKNLKKQSHKMVIFKSKPALSPRDSNEHESSPRDAKKKLLPGILRFLQNKKSDSDAVIDDSDKNRGVQDKAPSLGQMKQLASGRISLSNFDWTAHVPSDDRNYHSDEEGGGGGGGGGGRSDGEDDEDDIIIPHSAPIMFVGGGVALEPRKEINLWKRRTMGPPRPLQVTVNTVRSK